MMRHRIAVIPGDGVGLEHLGDAEAAALVMQGIRHATRHGPRTGDLGGTARTSEVGDAVAAAIGAPSGAVSV